MDPEENFKNAILLLDAEYIKAALHNGADVNLLVEAETTAMDKTSNNSEIQQLLHEAGGLHFALIGFIINNKASDMQWSELSLASLYNARKIVPDNSLQLKTSISKEILRKIVTNYLEGRKNIVDENGKQKKYFHFFGFFQKSLDEKDTAVNSLLDTLAGKGNNLLHLSTLRDGNLGKILRNFVKSGFAADLFDQNQNPRTVTQFIELLSNTPHQPHQIAN